MQAHEFDSNRQSLLAARASAMRYTPTASEQLLWNCVRARKLGVAFRRQVVLGRHIVDLFAPKVRLVVEVDGGWHRARRQADARRDEALRRLGCRVLRLDAELVMRELPAAVARIAAELEALAAAEWRPTTR